MGVRGQMKKKKNWKDENTSDDWKKENLNLIKTRMRGWQLDTFEESYKNKIEEGISLYKKNNSQKKI